MFENYIEHHTRKLEGYFDKTNIPIEQIIYDNSVPKYFINYLRAFINSRCIALQLDLIENYNFSQESMELAEAWRQFEDTYRNSFEFSNELLISLINSSTSLYFNYLTRPQTTLVNFIFQDYLFQSIHNIKERLKYFQEEDYLISRLTLWLEEQEFESNLPKINKFQFKKVVSNIENEYYKDFESSEINHWFELINSFVNFESNNKSIDTSLFAIYFDDKKWYGLKNYIIHHFLEQSLTKIEINDVVDLINHYLSDALLIVKESISEEPVFSKVINSNKEGSNLEEENNDEYYEENNEENNVDEYNTDNNSIENQELENTFLENTEKEIDAEEIEEDEVIQSEINNDELDELENKDASENTEVFTEEPVFLASENDAESNLILEQVDENAEFNPTVEEEIITELDFEEQLETTEESVENENGNENVFNNAVNSTDDNEDDIDFDLLADLISGGGDSNPSIESISNTNSAIVSNEEGVSDEEIENRLNTLEEKVNNLEFDNYRTIEEITEENSFSNIQISDINNIEINEIKKELLDLLLNLKKS